MASTSDAPSDVPLNAAERAENHLEILVAILIAVATVLSAVIAWRAFVAGDSAGDADFAGVAAALNAQGTRAYSAIIAYDNFSAFADYKQYSVLAQQLLADIEKLPADSPDLQPLQSQLSQTLVLLSYVRERFDNRFLTRDGNFDLQRNLGEIFSEAARLRDHDPAPQFSAADAFRNKNTQLQLSALFPAISLIFFALTEFFKTRIRYLMLIVGIILTSIGAVLLIVIESRML